MNVDRATFYSTMADRLERDPISEDQGRATVAMGRGFDKWRRFNRGQVLVWAETMDGRMVALTPWQNKVYQLARTRIDNGTISMRAMAAELGCSTSTVSRAMTKLMAWGFIGYLVGRGRYAGMLIFGMSKGDGFDRFRKAAKAKVRAWAKATNDRLSRTKINVATSFSWREIEAHGYGHVYVDVMDATMKREWTAADVAGVA